MPNRYGLLGSPTAAGMAPMANYGAGQTVTPTPTPDYGYGARYGTTAPKGLGFLGPLLRPDGNVMSEFSVGVNIDGQEMEIPSLVPTLTKQEVSTLLGLKEGQPIPQPIIQKATAHARDRLKAGYDPFAGPGEQQELYPEFKRAAIPTPK